MNTAAKAIAKKKNYARPVGSSARGGEGLIETKIAVEHRAARGVFTGRLIGLDINSEAYARLLRRACKKASGDPHKLERRSFFMVRHPSVPKQGTKRWGRLVKRRQHPKPETISAMRDIRAGKVVRVSSINHLFASLNADD